MSHARTIIVTGAAQGLGAAIANHFEDRGDDVVRADIQGDGCLHADVGRREGVRHVIDEALERHGRIDVLVLNAGVQHTAPVESFPEEQWDRLQDVMLKGPFLAMQVAWPALMESGGNVVVVSSTSAVAADPDKTAYVAAKAGVAGLVRAAALEGARVGIRVNAVAPGWMRTPLAERQLAAFADARGQTPDEALEAFTARQPIRRFVELREVAAAIDFLSGDGASAITGVLLPVDLGLLAA